MKKKKQVAKPQTDLVVDNNIVVAREKFLNWWKLTPEDRERVRL